MRTITKELGKIKSCYIGRSGYQGAMIGLSITFESKSGWATGTFIGTWDSSIEPSGTWTEKDRAKQYADVLYKVDELLRIAKVDRVERLVGVPVEVTFESNTLKSWRILDEVL